MHVFQTCGVPPSLGRIILLIIGWIRKRMNALKKSVVAYTYRTKGAPPRQGWRAERREPPGYAQTRSRIIGRLTPLGSPCRGTFPEAGCCSETGKRRRAERRKPPGHGRITRRL